MYKLDLGHSTKPLLIFSDLHLGTRQHKVTTYDICRMINTISPAAVIFNGDAFNFPCRRQAMQTLNYLRNNVRVQCPIHFINGNHDPIFDLPNMVVNYNGKTIFFEHGNQYAKQSAFLDFTGTYLNELCLKWFRINPQEWLRRVCARKKYGGKVKHLYVERRKIIEKYSSQSTYQAVVVGHTHYKETTMLPNNVLMINSGDWRNYTIIWPNLKVEQPDVIV